jgi:hypothetical protein
MASKISRMREQGRNCCSSLEKLRDPYYLGSRTAFRGPPLPHYATSVNALAHRFALRANSHKLSQIEEELLQQWILSLDPRITAPTSNAHQSLQRVFLGDMAISENSLHILHTFSSIRHSFDIYWTKFSFPYSKWY